MAEWYRRSPRDALNGMLGLSLEEQGFYNAALDLIYEEEGPIWPQALKRQLGIRESRTWNRVFPALIRKGKLIETRDGRITNERAMFEIAQLEADSGERKAAGSRGGRKRALKAFRSARGQGEMFETANSLATGAEKTNEINDRPQAELAHTRAHGSAGPARDRQLATSCRPVAGQSGNSFPTGAEKPNDFNATPQAPLEHIDSDLRQESPPLVPPLENDGPRLKSKRSQPLPPAWEPPEPTDRIAELVADWPEGEYDLEVEKFTNHAAANGRTCRDWDAAFRNWIIQAEQFKRTAHERPSGWLTHSVA